MEYDLREARIGDLDALLELYTFLTDRGIPNSLPEQSTELKALWESILADKNHHILLAIADGKPVSTCVLLIIPNLTHKQRPYALVENVVTHPDYRKRGYGTAVLDYAKSLAKMQGCYKIMLSTGSKLPATLDFYKRAGYNDTDKTAFIQWI